MPSKATPAVLALALAALPSLACAQDTLRPTGGVSTALGTHHPVAADGRRFRCFTLQTRPGERYRISLFSDAFVPIIRAGKGAACSSLSRPVEDRREGDERSAMVEIGGDGESWSVSAGALANGTGAFHLSVERTVTVPATPAPIEFGRSLSAALTPDDAVTPQFMAYDCYSFRAARGDDLVFTMRSSAFKPALQLYAGPDCQGQAISSRNEWTEGEAKLTESIVNSEVYSVRARSLQRDAFGPYTLTLSRNPQ